MLSIECYGFNSCFVDSHYVCLGCLQTELLSPFCAQRLLLVREAWARDTQELCDLIPQVLRYVTRLCFDRAQIHKTLHRWRDRRYCACDPGAYNCRMADDIERMETFKCKLTALLERVDGDGSRRINTI